MKTICFQACVVVVLTAQDLYGQGWQFRNVDTNGVNPTITLDSEDIPHVAYVQTGVSRFPVNHATWNAATGDFDIETAFEGGERWLDITMDHNDRAHITQHVHNFGGDLVHHWDSASVWVTERLFHQGHDGWSSAILFNSQNNACISYIDPACCSSQGRGMEYRQFDGATWTVEIIGSTPDVGMRAGTSMALGSDDNPHITYYDEVLGDLMYAVKTNDVWTFTAVDTAGDVGYYSSIQLDSLNRPRISYYKSLSDESGVVKHALFSGTVWILSTIDTLSNVFTGTTGGMTSLDLDASGKSHITYCDESVLRYAVVGKEIEIETIVDYSGTDTTLGWTTNMELDDTDTPHITYWIAANNNRTTCRYATRIPALAGPVRVNVGGRDYTSVHGEMFVGDRAYSVGGFGYASGDKRTIPGEIGNTDDDALYQSYRRDPSLEYLFDVPDGEYTVTCHFVEPTARAPGVRVFDLHAENEVVLDNFEIFLEAGDRMIAHTEVFDVSVLDGTINLEFSQVSGEGEPLVSAIEVSPLPLSFPRGDGVTTIANGFRLDQNYPNPFNGVTEIGFEIAEHGDVSLTVYDLTGKEVATLLNKELSPGRYQEAFDTADLASGVYVYRLSVSAHGSAGAGRSFVQSRKMMLLK